MIIHRCWTGPSQPPAEPWLAGLIRRMHPQDQLVDTEPPAEACELAQAVPVASDDQVRHLSNCTRWILLRDHGGWWLDHDVIPLRPLTPGAWTAGLGTTRRGMTGCAISLPQGHPLAAQMIEAIRCGEPGGPCPSVSGDGLLSTVAAHHRDVKVRPLPFDAEGRATGADQWAIHLWASSSARAAAIRGRYNP